MNTLRQQVKCKIVIQIKLNICIEAFHSLIKRERINCFRIKISSVIQSYLVLY